MFCRGYGESDFGLGAGRLGHCGDVSGFFLFRMRRCGFGVEVSLILHSRLTSCHVDSSQSGLHCELQ